MAQCTSSRFWEVACIFMQVCNISVMVLSSFKWDSIQGNKGYVESFSKSIAAVIKKKKDLTHRSCCSQGRNGRAYLFANVVNVAVGPKEDRQLTTGLHTVADIYCFQCQEVLGWKYEKAYEENQKYKEGKYILEKAKVMKENWWLSFA